MITNPPGPPKPLVVQAGAWLARNNTPATETVRDSDIPLKPDEPEAGRDLPPEIMRQLSR